MRAVNGPPSLSIDGRYAAWLSSGVRAPELVVVDVNSRAESARLATPGGRCRAFTWSRLPGVGLAVAHGDGSEKGALYRLDVAEETWTPLDDASGLSIAGLSDLRPEEVLVAACADYFVMSLRSRASTPVFENSGYAAVYFDQRFTPRLVETVNEDGSRDLRHADPSGDSADRALFLHIPHEETLTARFVEFSADGESVLFALPDGDSGTCLAALPCVPGKPAGEPKILHRALRADVSVISASPAKKYPDMVLGEEARIRCLGLETEVEASLGHLRRRMSAEPVVLERRDGDRVWLVSSCDPVAPAEYFVFEPERAALWKLSEAQPGHRRWNLECRPARVPLRDGSRALAYVTRATTTREDAAHRAPASAVLLVHGGPWRRSSWRYSERRVWLAAQGFTVIEPNFRGSTGLGAHWVNAADREWGGAMQQDLEDCIDWAVEQGLADPGRIALFGGSYGGYAVLQLAATSKADFRCVVATSPLTDLVEFVESPPEFWASAGPMLRRRIGDPRDAAQRARLETVSPLRNAAAIDTPVLLVHGVNDSRVPASMAQSMFLALARAGKDAALALLPGEGHEIVGSANRAAVDRLIAEHLAAYTLGRRAEQDTNPDLAESTLRLFESPTRREGHGSSFRP